MLMADFFKSVSQFLYVTKFLLFFTLPGIFERRNYTIEKIFELIL